MKEGEKLPEDEQYFATLPRYSTDISAAIIKRVNSERERLKRSDRHARMMRSYREYYGLGRGDIGGHTTSEVGSAGTQGELTTIQVNHYASLLQTMLTQATLQPPQWESVAINSDWESLGSAQLSDGLLDFYYQTKSLKGQLKGLAERGLLFGEAWIGGTWNANTGDMVGVQEVSLGPDGVKSLGEGDKAPKDAEIIERPVYNGDIDFELYTPYTCFPDPMAKDRSRPNWLTTIRFVNKWDLIAQFPQMREEILEATGQSEYMSELEYMDKSDVCDDTVGVVEFWHASTPAVPEGRHVLALSGDAEPLIDGPLPYDTIPVKRMMPRDIIMGTGGHTVFFDLLSICEALHAQYSAVLTNHTANAVQKYWQRTGENVPTYTQLGQGLAVIESDHKPEPLNLTYTPDEVFTFMGKLEDLLNMLTAQNDFTRGTADNVDLSGSAMAFLHSASVQANSGLQENLREAESELATHLIGVIRRYVDEPRIATIAGNHNLQALREYVGQDLHGVARVYVKAGTGIQDTQAGRMELAKTLQEAGYVANGQQFLQVLTTGRLEPMYERELGQLMLIRKENEILGGRGEGKLVVAPTDKHDLHIMEHACVLDDPTIRSDDEAVQRVSQHIMEHMQMLQNPAMAPLMAVLGVQSLAQPEAPPGEGGDGPALPGGGDPEPPRPPQAPVNPATGERAELAPGPMDAVA